MNKLKNALMCGSSLLFLSSSLSPILADTVTASSSTNKNSTSTAAASTSSTAAVNTLSSSEVVLKSSTSDTSTAKPTSTPTEQTASTSVSESAPKNVTASASETAKATTHNSEPSLSTGIKVAAGSNQSGTVQNNMSSTDASSASSMTSESSSVTADGSSSQSSNSNDTVSSTISISGGQQLVNVDKMTFDNANDKLVTNKDNVLSINFAPNEKSNLKMTFKYNLQPTDNASQVLLHSKGINITVNLVIPQKDGHDKIIKNVSPLITDENGEFTINFKNLDGAQINSQAYLQILLPDNVKIDGQHDLTYKLNVTNPADKNQDQNNQSQPGQKGDAQSIKDNTKHADKEAAKVTSPTDFQKNVRHLQDVEKYNDAPATNQSSQMPQQLDSQGNPVTNTQKTAMLAQTNATNTHAKILTGIGIVTAMIATSIFAVQSKDKRKFS